MCFGFFTESGVIFFLKPHNHFPLRIGKLRAIAIRRAEIQFPSTEIGVPV